MADTKIFEKIRLLWPSPTVVQNLISAQIYLWDGMKTMRSTTQPSITPIPTAGWRVALFLEDASSRSKMDLVSVRKSSTSSEMPLYACLTEIAPSMEVPVHELLPTEYQMGPLHVLCEPITVNRLNPQTLIYKYKPLSPLSRQSLLDSQAHYHQITSIASSHSPP
jgi:hypothetical protein